MVTTITARLISSKKEHVYLILGITPSYDLIRPTITKLLPYQTDHHWVIKILARLYLFKCLSMSQPVCLSVYVFTCVSVCLFVYLCVSLSMCLPVFTFCLCVYLCVCVSVYVSTCVSVCLLISGWCGFGTKIWLLSIFNYFFIVFKNPFWAYFIVKIVWMNRNQ